MKNRKLNPISKDKMMPFDLEKAIKGAVCCTDDGSATATFVRVNENADKGLHFIFFLKSRVQDLENGEQSFNAKGEFIPGRKSPFNLHLYKTK